MSTSIYIITHKTCWFPELNSYIPIWVGAYNKSNIPNDVLRDDVGDNISSFNDSCCELTGLYWIWKNTNDDYVGMVHYRRYFAKIDALMSIRGRYIVAHEREAFRIFSSEELTDLLQGYDFLVKQSEFRFLTLDQIFIKLLGKEFLDDLESVIRDSFTDYYQYFQLQKKTHRHFNCNMFFAKKAYVDKYCEFLFAVIKCMDERHIKKTGDRYHNRELGYVGEFLLQVWLNKNRLRFNPVDVVNINNDNYLVGSIVPLKELSKFIFSKV